MVFHNGLSYDYHFIIKELGKDSEGEFKCMGENTEKYQTFSVPVRKEVKRIDRNLEEITKIISKNLQFVESARFIGSPLSNVVDKLAERIHKIKYEYGDDNKKCETRN